MTLSTRIPVDPDEKFVEEVHCSECNTPIPAIPNWYAQVRVKFTCDVCRQKSPRLAAAAVTPPVAAVRVAGDPDEPALDEVVATDDDEETEADLEVDEAEEVDVVEAEVAEVEEEIADE